MSLLHASFEPGRLGTQHPLARYSDYQNTLASLLSGEQVAPFELPWESGRWSYYWEYLLGANYRRLEAQALLARVVPVRVKPTVTITAKLPVRSGLHVTAARTEGLIYPHAAVTVVTFDLEGDATLAETADEFAALASERRTTVAGQTARLGTVAELAAYYTNAFCDFGGVSEGSLGHRFRIFSVLSGTIGDPTPPSTEAQIPLSEWAAIRAITSLRPYRDYAGDTTEFPKLKLSWGRCKPTIFNEDAVSYVLVDNYNSTKPSNSCYHRNQVLLAAHLLTLMPLIIWGKPHYEAHDSVVEVDRLVPAAIDTIGALTSRGSYRSALTQKLIAMLQPPQERT
jgi:hypothetical protein